MPLSQNASSEEAQKDQQLQALETNDAPTRHPYTNAGWRREFNQGQDMLARVLFNQGFIEALREDWRKKDAEDSKEGKDTDNDQVDHKTNRSTEGNKVPKNGEGEDDDGDELGEEIDDSDEDEDEGDDDATGEDFKLENSIARVFLRKNLHKVSHETAEPWPKGIARIEECYGHVQFEDVEKLDPKEKPIAMVQENSRSGVYRNNRRPLNLFRLRALLQRLRYEEPSDDPSQRQPDVDQRRLCILGRHPEAAAILMENCSRNDAEALPELFYLHLNRKPSLGVFIPTCNVKQFTIRLGLPFYRAISKIRPNRGSSQHETLLIPDLGEFVVGQVTVVLVGVDEERWSAIAMIDGSTRKATIVDLDDSHSSDPITGSIHYEPIASHKARLYFPWMWKDLINQVRKDWAEVIDVITQRIKEKKRADAYLVTSNEPGVIDRLKSSIETAAQWDELLDPMKQELEGIVFAWKQFGKCGTKFFQDVSMSSGDTLATRDCFPGIEDTYVELEILLEQLRGSIGLLGKQHLNNVLNSKMGSQGLLATLYSAWRHERIALRTSDRQIAAAEKGLLSQENVARSAWKATLTTMALLPFMLVFTLFSMKESMIPLPTSFPVLIYSLLGFTLVMILLFTVLDTVLGAVANLFYAFIDLLLRVLHRGAKPPRQDVDGTDEPDESDEMGSPNWF